MQMGCCSRTFVCSANYDLGTANGREPEICLLAVLSVRLRRFSFEVVLEYACLATPVHVTIVTELSEIGVQSVGLVQRRDSTLSDFVGLFVVEGLDWHGALLRDLLIKESPLIGAGWSI